MQLTHVCLGREGEDAGKGHAVNISNNHTLCYNMPLSCMWLLVGQEGGVSGGGEEGGGGGQKTGLPLCFERALFLKNVAMICCCHKCCVHAVQLFQTDACTPSANRSGGVALFCTCYKWSKLLPGVFFFFFFFRVLISEPGCCSGTCVLFQRIKAVLASTVLVHWYALAWHQHHQTSL